MHLFSPLGVLQHAHDVELSLHVKATKRQFYLMWLDPTIVIHNIVSNLYTLIGDVPSKTDDEEEVCRGDAVPIDEGKWGRGHVGQAPTSC